VDVGIDPARHYGKAAEIIVHGARSAWLPSQNSGPLDGDADILLNAALAVQHRARANRDRLPRDYPRQSEARQE